MKLILLVVLIFSAATFAAGVGVGSLIHEVKVVTRTEYQYRDRPSTPIPTPEPTPTYCESLWYASQGDTNVEYAEAYDAGMKAGCRWIETVPPPSEGWEEVTP